MDLVIINDLHPRKLAFYLAEEEYLARRYPDRDFFFAWQVNPSVIIGRNQLLEKRLTWTIAMTTVWKFSVEKVAEGLCSPT